MPNQSHGVALWREPAQVGATPAATPRYLVADGSDITFDDVGPARYAFYPLEANGDYVLLDLEHVGYLVHDGSDWTIDDEGPAEGVFVADGADITISDDLTQTPAADLYYDVAGDPWLVLRSTKAFRAVKVRGDTYLY